MNILSFETPPDTKQLLIITETDGCFADVKTRSALRIAPMLDIRQHAYLLALDETSHYFAQMQAYQIMPDEEIFTITECNSLLPSKTLFPIQRSELIVMCAAKRS